MIMVKGEFLDSTRLHHHSGTGKQVDISSAYNVSIKTGTFTSLSTIFICWIVRHDKLSFKEELYCSENW